MKNDPAQNSLKIKDARDGAVFTVHVQPRASRNEVCGIHGEELKLRLTAPPVDDAANRLCVEFLAELLGVAKSRVTLIAGAKSRHKTIKVSDMNSEDVRTALASTAN